jgi:hypothetical protein
MYEFKEIEIYKPQSRIVATWEVNENCSDSTKEKLSYFLEKCEKLEALFINADCNLLEFYWFTSDDDINLNIEFSINDYEKFKSIISDLKEFFVEDLVCLHENTTFLDLDISEKIRSGSYVSSCNSKLTMQVSLEWRNWNSYIPTPDYFYASMW